MYKLVVLSVFLALASAEPSHHAVYAPVHTVLAPAAVSHQSRVDVHSKAVWAAPVHTVLAPAHTVLAPAAVSHQSRVDVHAKPVWAAPVHTYDAWAAPHAAWAAPHAAWTAPLAYKAPIVLDAHHGGHYIHKRSVWSAPLVVAPSAVSHQSRVDIHHKPLVAVAPVVHTYAAHAAPYVAHYAYPWSTRSYWGQKAYGIHPW